MADPAHETSCNVMRGVVVDTGFTFYVQESPIKYMEC